MYIRLLRMSPVDGSAIASSRSNLAFFFVRFSPSLSPSHLLSRSIAIRRRNVARCALWLLQLGGIIVT